MHFDGNDHCYDFHGSCNKAEALLDLFPQELLPGGLYNLTISFIITQYPYKFLTNGA